LRRALLHDAEHELGEFGGVRVLHRGASVPAAAISCNCDA
jgi:hypothetical protein